MYGLRDLIDNKGQYSDVWCLYRSFQVVALPVILLLDTILNATGFCRCVDVLLVQFLDLLFQLLGVLHTSQPTDGYCFELSTSARILTSVHCPQSKVFILISQETS